MTDTLHAVDVRHDCDVPNIDHPTFGERHQVVARWRCPECGQRWALEAEFLMHDRLYWSRKGNARWRWLRAERRRIEAAWRDRAGE